ncbi:hypothetical protein Bca4012_089965 [Brassica carinata]
MDARGSFDDTRDPNVASIANLISGYLKKHEFEEALSLFRTMPERSIVTWNALIGGFGQTGRNEEAASTFVDMVWESVVMPNELTFPCTIAAISNIASHGAEAIFAAGAREDDVDLRCCYFHRHLLRSLFLSLSALTFFSFSC